jgi:uncharacterized protein (TIGR02231 family)
VTRLTFLAVALCATGSLSVPHAWADDIIATSKVDAATVYPQGAEVTRLAKVKLPAGEHTLILNDLPGTLLPASVRAEGRSGGKLDIASIDIRRVALVEADTPALETDRKRIEAEIDKIRDEQTLLGAAKEAAEAQKLLLANLVMAPTRDGTESKGATSPAQHDWSPLLGLVGERMEKAQRSLLELAIKSRDIDKAIADLKKKLLTQAPTPKDRTEVKVFVTAAAAQDAEILIRYQIAEASWSALYDARLETGSKAKPARLSLVRRASVQQLSGEPWDGIALSLSTAKPNAATSAPMLAMLRVDLQPEGAPVAYAAPSAPSKTEAGRFRFLGSQGAAYDNVNATNPDQAQELSSEISAQPFQSVFAVPGRVSVANTNEMKRILIGKDDFDPQLIVRAVPRLDLTAYLYAVMSIPKSAAVFAAGQVTLYRDNVMVGNTTLPQLVAGETHELGFGADDLIKVSRAVLDDKKGESGVFTSYQVEARNFEITVKNLRGTPVQVRVLDRIPISMQQDIKVDPTFGLAPSRKDVNGIRGTVVWDLEMTPNDQKVLAVGYRITAPSGKRISYAEANDQADQIHRFGASTKF